MQIKLAKVHVDDHERIRARGGEFSTHPTDVTASTIAQFSDTCGNLIQITQLKW